MEVNANSMHGELMNMVHLALTEENMFSLSRLANRKSRKSVPKHKLGGYIPSYEEAKSAANFLGCSLNDLYFLPESFTPFCYFKEFVYIPLPSLRLDILEQIKAREQINLRERHVKDLTKQREGFEELFYFLDKPILFLVYRQQFNKIPPSLRYEIFRNVYIRSEYGFSYLSQEEMKLVARYRTEDRINRLTNSLKGLPDPVQIYRGVGTRSLPPDKAYSWTFSYDVAKFFAYRYGEGSIYRAFVDKRDIIDYFDDFTESEILVLPDSLRQVTLFE